MDEVSAEVGGSLVDVCDLFPQYPEQIADHLNIIANMPQVEPHIR